MMRDLRTPFFKSTIIRAWSGISRHAVVLRTVWGSHRGQVLISAKILISNHLNYFFEFEKEYADFSNGIKAPMQVTNKYAIENNVSIEEIFQIAIRQYTQNADKLAIEEEISNFLFFDTFFINRFTGIFC